MQIIARRYRAGVSSELPHSCDKVPFGVFHSLDKHCAMHGQIYAFERAEFGKAVQDLGLKRFIRLPRDRPASNGARMHGRKNFCVIIIQPRKIRVSDERVTPKDAKIPLGGDDGIIGAALHMQPADRNALHNSQLP